MLNLWRKIRVPIVVLSGMSLIVLLASTFVGLPLFSELRERGQRVVAQALPVLSTEQRAIETLDKRLETAGLKLGAPVFVRIFKREAELEVWMEDGSRYRKLHTYPICYFSGFLGPKLKEGDRQSPEGFYVVTRKQLNPGSRYYRAFNIAFPNEYDRAHGLTGSALMVHGGCVSIGCYAMTDLGIGEIYRVVEKALLSGQQKVPVHIFPFKMTEANITSHPSGEWLSFWRNLKEGYDLFEQNKVPPTASVCGKRYAFDTQTQNCKAIAGW